MTQKGRPKKTRDELEPIILLINDREEQAYSHSDASVYLGISSTALNNLIKEGRIRRYERGFGRETYMLKRDLDDLLRARPVEDS
jgi:hypothetical protein